MATGFALSDTSCPQRRPLGTAGKLADIDEAEAPGKLSIPSSLRRSGSGDNVRRQLIVEKIHAITQGKFALFQPLQL